MSSILEAIAAEQAAFRKGPACSIGQMLDTLDDKERVAVEGAIDDPTNPYTVLARAFTKAGHKIGAEAIRRHRSRICNCRES